MESALRHGLERDEFVLHYQPQCAIATQAVSGGAIQSDAG